MGMLGSDLLEYLNLQGEAVTGFHRGNLDLDPTNQEPLAQLATFDVVVNCVAYTKVDLAEDEPEKAYLANVLVPLKLAIELQDKPTRLIHISTDYVFDGTKAANYLPGDKRSPLGVYGKTKALGEEFLLGEFPNTQVVRTSWLYGRAGKNFPKTIGQMLAGGDSVRVVSDQVGSPTHTLDLSEFIHVAGTAPLQERILHGVSNGSTSWFGFAQAIAESLNISKERVQAVSTAEFPTKAERPAYSVL
jgi:dTDP-4-dehydrorhamnose reductase